MGQKIKDTVTGSSSSTTHTGSRDYDNTRSTGSGYDETQRGHGTGIGSNTHGTGVGSTTGTHGTGTSYGDSRTTGQKVEDAVLPGQPSQRNTGTGYGTTGTQHGSGVPHEPSLGVDQSARQTTSGTDRHTTGSNQDARPLMDRLS
jgi:hypothetical protein